MSGSPIAAPSDNRAPLSEITTVNGRSYRVASIERSRLASDRTSRVAVLFNEDDLRAKRLRAASLPLLTGLSTIVLLTSVTYSLTNRLIGRLSRLQQQVNKIAEGDFQTILPPGSLDEVGLLSSSIQTMSDQLRRMWATLRRQQGEKLLHQMAGGLSHQLRNSITGARMAIELHVKQCRQPDEASQIAIAQLDQTEAYVKRLLLAASGKQEADQPRTMGECLSEVRDTLSATARHLNVTLSWQLEGELNQMVVSDGPSLASAVSNLVLNALQAATEVSVMVRADGNVATIAVVDNGPGPPASVADEIFEPFVTSKPEGLGLGLPVVAESVRRLGGTVSWDRVSHHTQFSMSIPVKRV
jgi:signal transduction histidine kinase